jgi:hypothetical protein
MENTQAEKLGQSSTKYHRSAKMFTMRDYHLSEEVHENKNLVLYRGVREDDKPPVLVRLLKPECPTHEELDLFDMTMKLQKN